MKTDQPTTVELGPQSCWGVPAQRDGQPIRILLVDDDANDAALVKQALDEDGLAARVTHATTVEEARRALGANSWDAVICDFDLGAGSGLDVLASARAVDGDLPFVLVSGAIDDEAAVAAMRAGAQDYVLKENLARLAPAVRRELLEAGGRRERCLAEARYRSLVYCSLQGLVMLQHGRVVISNQAAADILCVSSEELVGLGVEELLEHVHPDDRAAVRRGVGTLAADTHGPVRFEVRLARPDGASRWVEVRVQATRVGRALALQVALADITCRREREREVEAIATLATALRSAEDRDEMVQLLLAQTLELLHAEGTALASTGRVQGAIQLELGGGVWAGAPQQCADGLVSLSGRIFTSGQPLVLDLAESHEEPPLHGDGPQPRYLAGVPLVAREAVIGTLWIGRGRPVEAVDLRVLKAIGDMAASALRRVGLHEETELRLRRLHALRAIDLAITTSRELDLTFDVILEQVTSQLGVDAASILRVEEGRVVRVGAARGRAPDGGAAGPAEPGGLLGRVMSSQRLVECPDLGAATLETERDRSIAAAGFASYAAVPLLVGGELAGVLELMRRFPQALDEEGRGFLETVAWQASIALDAAAMVDELQQTNRQLRQAYESTLEGWARALELRDQETEGHTRRVTELTLTLAREFGIGDEELVHIRRGALLHDIGKLGIPDSVLLKPGPLDDREWEIMRRHPVLAVEMLGPLPHLQPALSIPYCHHERWDGTGYPRGLAGEEIPLAARLFAVVDLWDALASDRPYRTAWSVEEIVAHVRREAGCHLDPRVVEVFLDRVLPAHLGAAGDNPAELPRSRRRARRQEEPRPHTRPLG